jgi:nifR3 family TIM-barrel protein
VLFSLAKPLRIGPLTLANNLLLAPIAGYCDVSFRLVARSCGDVGLAVTDLLSAEGVLRQTAHTVRLLQTDERDRPLSMQLYGSNIERLCDAARWAEDHGADVVDINMGCPVDKVTKKDGGSKLLCDPPFALKLAEAVRKSLRRVPLTVKMRLGWDDSCIVAPALAAAMEDVGVAMVTVHGRTTEMKFSGQARLDGIAEVVSAVKSMPVIGNGDVRTPADAERMLRVTGCAGVMIGRAALSRPWIFRDVWSHFTTGTVPPEPTIDEKLDLVVAHFEQMLRFRGERSAITEMRKRISWYGKSMAPCRWLKERVRLMNDAAEFREIVARFRDWRHRRDERLGHCRDERLRRQRRSCEPISLERA